MNAIEVKNLVKTFGKSTAVNKLSFSVPEGEIFGLLGSNGAGKTTTINMLTGLLLPNSGELKILGMDGYRDIEKIRKNIALVPQTISLYENLTVYENLEFFGGLYINDKNRLKESIEEMLDVFKLKEKKDIRVLNLSGGYQRRCSVGCALISKPKILFLDEPLTGIDVYTNEVILDFIKSIKGLTIIFTTHTIEEAEEVCDYIVFINKGKKMIEGRPEKIIEKYAKTLGEKVVIEFDDKVDVVKTEKHLKKEGFNFRNMQLEGNTLSFISKNLGTRIVEVIDSLKPLEYDVLNIDIKKPNLETIFLYLLDKKKKQKK